MPTIIVPPKSHDKTLLAFLRKQFPVGFVHKAFRKKKVFINSERAREDQIVQPGDKITLEVEFSKEQQKPLATFEILAETEDFLILNKPKGIAVHEGKTADYNHTLIGMLRKSGKGPYYLVHRLDQNTSGCLIIAKSLESLENFKNLFKSGQVKKTYLALVKGKLQKRQGSIMLPLPGRENTKVSARTDYKKIHEYQTTTLVEVIMTTGRKHQIRVHFSMLKNPIVLDSKYGDFAFNKEFQKKFGLKTHFLHASGILFDWKGKKQTFEAPLPKDLERTLRKLS